MVTVTTRGREIGIPSHPDEMTARQYGKYLRICLLDRFGNSDNGTVRRLLLSALIDIRPSYAILRPEYIAELDSQLSLLDRFFDDTGHLRLDVSRNLMPEVIAGGKCYQGPGDFLDGVPFGNFVKCLTISDDSGNPESAADIARTLYGMPDGTEVSAELALHCASMLAAVWRAVTEAPVEINGKKIDFRIIFRSGGERRADDRTGWAGIAFEVAQSGVFGRLSEVEQTDFWTVLLYLYKCRFEYLEEKRKSKP